jgi:toxin ParE1/3/4
MVNFQLTELAKQDLRSIGRYTQITWGREQRNTYLAKIDAAFNLLVMEPQLGKSCDDLRAGYRKYPVGRHLIFYRQLADRIEIIRILHQRMDVEARLVDDQQPP